MVTFTSIAIAATTLLGLTTAAPSTVRGTGVTHRIFAGSTTADRGLHFEPENVVAEIGDMIEVHFLPKNHTFVQSSFDKPCEPLEGGQGVFSGFNFFTSVGEAPHVFNFMVKDKNPMWYYCSQAVGNHCQNGMTGVINQDFNSDKTLAAHKQKAKETVIIQPSVDSLQSQGGWILPNKPL
ncbi:hypothetical protein P153DRAFT_289438 [Dothidotthia symphoricarpi CBS 119687]|uniref:Cupredoxin n=1 Tax=Dothidotthia symphoricarpi CBS 119687 TaxID=1392245 RepID=A0A6A6ADD1_9PLEO|nr:uncharacterized protein P153DRAFT_289438 [Dothidotthia symphoricarpi CBS 119687]KAF2129780.1 hypothetical protein P153DRAFT_289438 [Dothidotthia symphoricarpi CBS 119687]